MVHVELGKRRFLQHDVQLLMRCAYLLKANHICIGIGQPFKTTSTGCRADSIDIGGDYSKHLRIVPD
ncbi:unannotated protein [freshwater metagenome]|uniref:Unannotated protein n=1 Tax=freshwater metagenome TaxID=449393 RepID=A0A6J6LGP0_9ZZZZ